MPAVNLTVPQTLDPINWFPNRESFYQFLGNCSVDISGNNLPVATTTTYGAVKQASSSGFIPSVVTPEYLSINDGATSNSVPLASYVDQIWARLQQVQTDLTALKAAMVTAGQLDL